MGRGDLIIFVYMERMSNITQIAKWLSFEKYQVEISNI